MARYIYIIYHNKKVLYSCAGEIIYCHSSRRSSNRRSDIIICTHTDTSSHKNIYHVYINNTTFCLYIYIKLCLELTLRYCFENNNTILLYVILICPTVHLVPWPIPSYCTSDQWPNCSFCLVFTTAVTIYILYVYVCVCVRSIKSPNMNFKPSYTIPL